MVVYDNIFLVVLSTENPELKKCSSMTIVKLFTDQSEVNVFAAGCSTQDVGSG